MILLLGCTGESGETGESAPLVQETGVMIHAPDLPAELSADEIQTTIDTIIDEELFLPFEIHTWFMGVFEDLETGAEGCPTADATKGEEGRWASFWSGECAGGRYTVSGNWLLDITEGSDTDLYYLQAVELWSFTGTVLPDEGEVSGGGQAVVVWQQEGESAIVRMDTLGAFVDEGGPEVLQSGIAPGITLEGTWSPTSGYDGTLSGPIGAGETALDFDDLTFVSDCGAPSGTLRVRDPSSLWWEVELPTDCSGCGPLTYDGVDQGELCPGANIRGVLEARFGNWYESHR